MPQSRSVDAYGDIAPWLDQALVDGGIEIVMPSAKAAMSYKFRCYAYRKALKAQNEKLFTTTEPMYGISPYDTLSFSVQERGNEVLLVIRPLQAPPFEVRKLA